MIKKENALLKEYTTFKIGGPAKLMLEPEAVEELSSLIKDLTAKKERFMVIGNGSNLLFSDEGFNGVIIRTVNLPAGKLVASMAKEYSAEGYTGFEFATGIPGSLGGAVYMNAGAYGGEMKVILNTVTSVTKDGNIVKRNASDCGFSYRHSIYWKNDEIIVDADFSLEKGNPDEISAKIKELTTQRKAKQPLQYGSAGSFFKRPEGHFAGKLIEDAGLKGLTVGGAQVSDFHAGFIINRGDATAKDVINLMNIVRETVMNKFGVLLEPEVRIIEF